MARPRHSRLVFFRVNYPHWWGKNEALRVLEDSFSLNQGQKGDYKRRSWYTGEFERLSSGRWFFKLGKEREDLTHGTIRVDAKGKYVFPVEGEGAVVPTVRGLYAPEHSLLSIETTAEISATQIQGSLEDIMRNTRTELLRKKIEAGDLGEIVLRPLLKKSDFFAWADEMEEVNSVSFQFWPTNPNPLKSFKAWDEAQREAQSDETHLTVRSKTKGKGLKVKSELVETGIAQVQAGYGKASASGVTKDGIHRTWHSLRDLVMRPVKWLEDRQELDKAWTDAATDAEKQHDKKRK